MTRHILTVTYFSFLLLLCVGCSRVSETDKRVDKVLRQMTLEEKVGQLNHLKLKYSTDIYAQNIKMHDAIKSGRVGALTPRLTIEELTKWQHLAVDSTRLGIPLLFGADIIHGYRTIFPIPLGQAASFDLNLITETERIAAIEATAAGFNWNFAPMMDVTREPRWGRCMESAGEDTYLNSEIAKARIQGFMGNDLSLHNTMLTTAKHFAAYGAAEGGREYNTVDVSERVLREVYLPPFEAAVEAGVSTIMNGFNVVDRVPASAHKKLLSDILKDEWGFDGFTISDANSFFELIAHGAAKDRKEAALKCMTSGADMDLWSQVYMDYLPQIVAEGKVDERQIDDAVRRILKAKFDCGIMDNPYLYLDAFRLDSVLLHPNHLAKAEQLATESFVLLKNDNKALPIAAHKRIALVGPLANTTREKAMMGAWTIFGKSNDIVTVYQGMKEVMGDENILLANANDDVHTISPADIEAALQVGRKADIIVIALGEYGLQSGEGRSRADISLPGNQDELIEALNQLNKPMVGLVFSGRPLVLTKVEPYLDAIMMCWQPGTMAGSAIAKVINGEVSPSGKLPMTMPYHAGQVPIYYNALNTGRPRLGVDDERWGVSNYLDVPNEPLYHFGYGLTYSNFAYSAITLSDSCMKRGQNITVSVSVNNTGNCDAVEVVQCYIQDVAASVSRPVRELKAFKRINIQAKQSVQVSFTLSEKDLKYWDINMNYTADEGEFKIYIGGDSNTTNQATFYLNN